MDYLYTTTAVPVIILLPVPFSLHVIEHSTNRFLMDVILTSARTIWSTYKGRINFKFCVKTREPAPGNFVPIMPEMKALIKAPWTTGDANGEFAGGEVV